MEWGQASVIEGRKVELMVKVFSEEGDDCGVWIEGCKMERRLAKRVWCIEMESSA